MVDEDHIFLRGWWWDAEGLVEDLDLISPPSVGEIDDRLDDTETELDDCGDTRESALQSETQDDGHYGDESRTDREQAAPDQDDSEPGDGKRKTTTFGGVADLPTDGQESGLPEAQPSGRLPPARLPILKSLVRVPRPDVAELFRPNYGDRADDAANGFFGLVRVPEPAERHRGYRLELRPAVGDPLQAGNRPPIHEPFASREVVLRSLPKDQAPNLKLLRDHLIPALEPLQAQCRLQTTVTTRFAFGEATKPPETSLLVPLFRRLDLVEHQMAHLAADPALADCELLYILDSPTLAAELEQTLFHLSRLFGVAARGLVLERNVGFAAAINSAAAEARGRRLVLLHSDVFPDRPGWIGAMADLLDSKPRIGTVGPRPAL